MTWHRRKSDLEGRVPRILPCSQPPTTTSCLDAMLRPEGTVASHVRLLGYNLSAVPLWGGVQSQTEDTLTAMGMMRCFKRHSLPGPPAQAGPARCVILPYLRYYPYVLTLMQLKRIYATCCLVLSGMPCTGCATCGGLPPLVFHPRKPDPSDA